MTQRTTPPFRADHVGSLLRTPVLKAAREQRARNEITVEAFKAIEENARFEGTSRRDDNAVDKPRAGAGRPQSSAHTLVGDAGRKLNGSPEKETQAAPAAG